MKADGWERIYRERGDLQFDVLPKIRRASRTFKEKSYEKILDLGCGTGKHSTFLAYAGFQVYATDLSETGIKIAQGKAKSLGLNNIHFKQHDMKVIPFADSFFNAVVCTWTIYHGKLADIQKTIGETHRVLKTGGTIITDFLSLDDYSYGLGHEIEKNTFVGQKKEEEDVPHHYCSKEELIRLFSEFKPVKIGLSSNSYLDDRGEECVRKYFDVEAIK